MQAFLGDEGLKRETIARLHRDLAGGAIDRDATGWRDGRGGVVGSLAHTGDLAVAADTLGIPAEVLALVDHFTTNVCFHVLPAADVADRFLEACPVGADLGGAVPALMRRLGDAAPTAQAPDEVAECDRLRALIAAPRDTPEAAAAVVDGWLDICCRIDVWRSGWSEADEATAQAALQDLWHASRDERRGGDWPDYPAMFRASHPDLAAGYERALDLHVRSYDRRARQVVDWFVAEVAAAGRRA